MSVRDIGWALEKANYPLLLSSPVRDLDALRAFEVERPGHAYKQAAVMSLLGQGVPAGGIRKLIERSPWPEESKIKWLANLADLAKKARACPFCETDGPEEDCPVGAYMASKEAALTPMEVDLLG